MRLMMTLPLALMAGLFALGQPPGPPKVRSVRSFQIPALAVDNNLRATHPAGQTRTVYLGAKKSPKGKATLQLKNYKKLASGDPLPASYDWSAKAMRSIRGTYGNSDEGDCVVASGEHGLGIVSANAPGGTELVSSDAESLQEYHRIGGDGDNGLVPVEALEDWRVNGLLCNGKRRKLEAWGDFDAADPEQVKTVIIVFTGRLDFNVPSEWMQKAYDGAVWTAPRSYDFVGGHDVRMIGFDAEGVWIATWGLRIKIPWAVLKDKNIFNESHFELLPDSIGTGGVGGNGINWVTLQADVTAIKNGSLPSWQPDVGPNPPVPPTPPDPNPPTPPEPVPPNPIPPTPVPPAPPAPCVRQPWIYFGLFPNRPALVHRCR